MVIFHMPGNNNVFIDRFNKRMCSWNTIDHIVDNSLDGTMKKTREKEGHARGELR